MENTESNFNKKLSQFERDLVRYAIWLFGTFVDEAFHGNVETYEKFIKKFTVLCNKCGKRKGSPEEAEQLVKCQNLVNQYLSLPSSVERKLVPSYSFEGRKLRVKSSKIRIWLSDAGFRLTNNGSHLRKKDGGWTTTRHFSRNVFPDEPDILYSFYKEKLKPETKERFKAIKCKYSKKENEK